MYLTKKIKILMDEFDNNVNLPKNFDLYVEKIKVSHKLIIKSKNGYHCDYCNSDFKKKRITKKLYGEKLIKCPICKQTLIVKSNRIKNYIQKDNFCIIERFKGYYIFRLFQIETTYRNGNYSSHICEFGRKLFDDNFGYIYEIYNDNISATISGKYVNHKEFLNFNWKRNGSYYHTLGDVYKLYPYNLKKLFKGTKWQYSQIWDFAKHITYFDISNFMYSYSNSIEYLIKNRLYILTNDLLENTSHNYILKLDYKYIKQNLKFIRKYNLKIDEITIMQYFNIFDIKIIRKYSEYADNLIDILHELNIKLELVDKYVKDAQDGFCEYIDYLQICKLLEYDMKDKKILYPCNAADSHDKVLKLYNNIKDKTYQKAIKKRYEIIKKYAYKDKKYIVYPVKSQKELINESKQQNNCVKTYAERISKGKCDIYFMRLTSNVNKSLVTIEVKNNKVVQKRTKNNCDTTLEQNKFIEKWERKILNNG